MRTFSTCNVFAWAQGRCRCLTLLINYSTCSDNGFVLGLGLSDSRVLERSESVRHVISGGRVVGIVVAVEHLEAVVLVDERLLRRFAHFLPRIGYTRTVHTYSTVKESCTRVNQ